MENLRDLACLATKLYFEDADIVQNKLPAKAKDLARGFTEIIRPFQRDWFSIPGFGHLEDLCTDAINFKIDLLTSAHEHRLRFFPRGEMFDDVWMEGQDRNGISLLIAGSVYKRVLFCIFPAVVQAPPTQLGNCSEVGMAFTACKRLEWQPSDMELEGIVVVSKAVVLLE